jgi:glycosyltransferase involved in cell wall biosynthesis
MIDIDKPLTIGIDASRAATERLSGTERYSRRIIRALLDVGVDQQFRLYLNRRSPMDLCQRANVVQRPIPFPRAWTHARLSSELAVHPVDALFVPAHVVPPVHPRNTVVTIHDLGYLHEPEAHTGWSRRYLDWSTRWSVRAARRVIAISQTTKIDLAAFYQVDPAKISVIYHGVDERFRPARDDDIARVRAQLGVADPFILFVGTVQPRKNLPRLVEAFDTIAAGNPNLRLVIAGRMGWKTDEIERSISSARNRSRIVQAGHVGDDTLPALYSAAELLALPSLYEGFGLPVLEAMACGTPVLVSNRGALPEIAGDAAIVIEPTSVPDLVAGLRAALDPDLRDGRVACGRARAATFTWAKSGAETLRLILDHRDACPD